MSSEQDVKKMLVSLEVKKKKMIAENEKMKALPQINNKKTSHVRERNFF
jgi:hypothetical protein